MCPRSPTTTLHHCNLKNCNNSDTKKRRNDALRSFILPVDQCDEVELLEELVEAAAELDDELLLRDDELRLLLLARFVR